jgi:hypothetical protein
MTEPEPRWKAALAVFIVLVLLMCGCYGFLYQTDDCNSIGGHVEQVSAYKEVKCVVP